MYALKNLTGMIDMVCLCPSERGSETDDHVVVMLVYAIAQTHVTRQEAGSFKATRPSISVLVIKSWQDLITAHTANLGK